MKEIYLGFKAYDVHELLCHAIAEAGGMYASAGITAKLIDTTFLPEDAIPINTFHVACGAALGDFLSGLNRRVLYVACDRPMFWLYGRAGVDRIEQLSTGQVATFPTIAPPAKFLQKLFENEGIAPDLLPSRDDIARLSLLVSGSVDAALLSSLFTPAEVVQRGCNQLAFIGENLRLPSSGLAVSGDFLSRQAGLVTSMVDIYQQAMKIIFDDDQTLLRKVLASDFRMPPAELDQTVQIIRNCYNPLGYSSDSLLQSAVDNVAKAMNVETRPADELYDFSFLKNLKKFRRDSCA